MKTDNQPPVFDDGLLPISIANGTGEPTKHLIDVLMLRITCDEAEKAHNLQTDSDGKYIATAEFLSDLAARIGAMHMGVPNCSVSVAFQLWTVGIDRFNTITQGSPQ